MHVDDLEDSPLVALARLIANAGTADAQADSKPPSRTTLTRERPMPRPPLRLPTDYQLRFAGIVLLGMLVCVQMLIYAKMPARPPTMGEWIAASDKSRPASDLEGLVNRLPFVRIHGGDVTVDGSVSIDGTVEAEIVR